MKSYILVLLFNVLQKFSSRRIFSIILVWTSLAFGFGCSDILEEDLTNVEVNVIAPGNDCEINSSLVTFLWDSISGAERYKIQVVKPNFDHVTTVVMDTTVTKCILKVQLVNGAYEWRIRAENGSYSTKYLRRSFIIKELAVIDTTKVVSSIRYSR